MANFEFAGFDYQPTNAASTETTEKGSFLDFVDGDDYTDNKFVKKAKKAVKSARKQNKKIKKLSSKHKDLEKEISTLKADIASLKKSAYVSKIAELVNSDNITERKRLASELHKMEV